MSLSRECKICGEKMKEFMLAGVSLKKHLGLPTSDFIILCEQCWDNEMEQMNEPKINVVIEHEYDDRKMGEFW